MPCFLLGVVDNHSIQQNADVVKLKLNQFFDVFVLDDDDVVSPVSELYGQIKMDRYLWTMGLVDHCVIAHSANKGDIVPMAKHTVAKMVSWLVAFFVEVVSE